jgi:hypothetical protein
VGRQSEVERLVRLLGSSAQGRGAAVTITGEHGVGNYVKRSLM